MRSIRFRLAVWYTVALAIGLVAFAAAVWISTWMSLRGDVQITLREQVHNVGVFLRAEMADPLSEELREYAQALPDSIFMKVDASDGSPIFNSQPQFPWNGVQPWRHDRYQVMSGDVTAGSVRWKVSFAHSLRRVDEILNRLLWLLLALAPVIILIASLGGIWLSRKAMRPVDEITAAARGIGIDDLSSRLTVPQTGDELQRLSETWNEMLARLEDAVTRLSRFTADASHELRTPVAVIRSTAEIAGRRSRPEEAYRSALASIALESERMTALIDDLLFLARCDANDLNLPMTFFPLSEVLEEIQTSMQPLAQSRGIELHSDIPGEAATVWGNRSAIRRLLLILVDNAIKYSRPHGVVRIQTDLQPDEIHLRVTDEGFGIPSAELPFVFQRFYRGAAAREGGNNGLGLGLALASGIAQQHRSKLEVSSTSEQGSVFELALPVGTP